MSPSRAYSADTVLRQFTRACIAAHRSITRRHDHTEPERVWLGQAFEALTAIVQDGNQAVRPRLHRVRAGKQTTWTRDEPVRLGEAT